SGVSQVAPDGDIVVCDAGSGHSGQFLTAMSAQNYGLLSLRPRQAFDFGGRTGTITYNVDAINAGNLGWYTSLFVTDEPYAAANHHLSVVGTIPRYGLGLTFDDQCGSNGSFARVDQAYLFNDYVESTVGLSGTQCVQTERGALNHV